MTDWFGRPVLHVTDVEASLRFYVDQLGLTSPWRYEEDGRARVAQVERQGCALIVSDHWPEKVGKGLMFISLNVEPPTREAAIAAVDALRAELEGRGVPVKDGSWGYRLLVVDDPDGNRLSSTIRARRHRQLRAAERRHRPLKQRLRQPAAIGIPEASFAVRSNRGDILGAGLRRDLEVGHHAVLDVAFHGGPIRCVKLEIRGPGFGQAGRSRMRFPSVCMSMSCRAIMPVPPLSKSGIQSCPVLQNQGKRWFP